MPLEPSNNTREVTTPSDLFFRFTPTEATTESGCWLRASGPVILKTCPHPISSLSTSNSLLASSDTKELLCCQEGSPCSGSPHLFFAGCRAGRRGNRAIGQTHTSGPRAAQDQVRIPHCRLDLLLLGSCACPNVRDELPLTSSTRLRRDRKDTAQSPCAARQHSFMRCPRGICGTPRAIGSVMPTLASHSSRRSHQRRLPHAGPACTLGRWSRPQTNLHLALLLLSMFRPSDLGSGAHSA